MPRPRLNVRAAIVGLLAVAVAVTFALPFLPYANQNPQTGEVSHSWTTKPVPATTDVVDLYWLMFWIGVVILAIVEGGIIASVILFRERPGHQAKVFHGNPLLEFAWTLIPAIIVVSLSALSFKSLSVLSDTSQAQMTIEVTGRQWFWTFRYPDADFEVREEVHIPTNQKVKFVIRAGDVIHSFWVPALSGKLDAVPGRDQAVWMIAPEPGTFLGQCAEFCGLRHADMLLKVVAEGPDQVKAWIEQKKREEADVANLPALGQQVAQQTCVVCHTFTKGQTSPNPQAPNLSEYGAKGPFIAELRRLKDSGDPDWLKKWVTNAPAIKPGTGMPPWQGILQPRQIDAVVAYLMTLR